MLTLTARMQSDTMMWIQRSQEFIDICHELGEEHETHALRAEAEMGAALHYLGRHEEGMAKLDSVINLLDASFQREENRGTFDELDALIIALKRKIGVLGSHDLYAETLPLARRIIERLDDYEAHPDQYHDGSHQSLTMLWILRAQKTKTYNMMITDVDINLLTIALTAGVLALGAVCLWQWYNIRSLKRTLSKFIRENLRYKYGSLGLADGGERRA